MARVIHFELPVDDIERAKQFYAAALDWSFQAWGGPSDYLFAITGDPAMPGIDGALVTRSESSQLVNTIGVEDLDATLTRITAAGGTIVAPKSAVPGVGWLAYARDTEGNLFGLMQADEAAGG